MNTFTIAFYGLCAYTRRLNNKEATVLLTNYHHPHTPLLTMYLDSLENAEHLELSELEESLLELLNSSRPLRQLEISDYEIRILPGGQSAAAANLALMNLGKVKAGCPSPDGSDSGDIGWFADLNALSGKRVDSALLSGDLQSHRVKTRVLLTQGILACLDQARDHGTIHKFHFGNPADARALGDAAQYTLETDHETAVLELRRKVHGSTKKDLAITLRLPTTAWISNLPPKAAAVPLSHFDAFNLVLPLRPNLPMPQKTDPCTEAGKTESDRPIPCPQGMLE